MKKLQKITILYENVKHPMNNQLESGWGFSALVELDQKKILFDVGWHGNSLLRNSNNLGISLKDIDAIILSHAHWDHIGGLPTVLENTNNPDIYLPNDFSLNQTKEIHRLLPNCFVQRVKNFTILERISPNLASTGTHKAQGPIGEQALLIKYGAQNESLLLVGCMHPGLQPFLDSTKNYEKDFKINAIMGGFHGFKDINIIRNSEIKQIHLGHCTKYALEFQKLENCDIHNIHIGYELNLE